MLYPVNYNYPSLVSNLVPNYFPFSIEPNIINLLSNISTGIIGFSPISIPIPGIPRFSNITQSISNYWNNFIKIGDNHYQCDLSDPEMKEKLIEMITPQVEKNNTREDKQDISVRFTYYCGGNNIERQLKELVSNIKEKVKKKIIK